MNITLAAANSRQSVPEGLMSPEFVETQTAEGAAADLVLRILSFRDSIARDKQSIIDTANETNEHFSRSALENLNSQIAEYERQIVEAAIALAEMIERAEVA